MGFVDLVNQTLFVSLNVFNVYLLTLLNTWFFNHDMYIIEQHSNYEIYHTNLNIECFS